MIKSFIYCWAIYWICVLMLPVHSVFPAIVEAFLLQFFFVVLVLIGYFVVIPTRREVVMPDIYCPNIDYVRALVYLSLWMSLIGFAFLLYDKIYVQNIDYSSGLAVAREQWRELGEEREGQASSIWSALGYLLGSAYYVTAVLIITQFKKFSNKERSWLTAAIFLFSLSNSIITGGRSNFLLIGVVALSAFYSRQKLNVSCVFSSQKQRAFFSVVTLVTLVYIVYVFYSRAEASDELVYDYVVGFLPYMGLEFDAWYVNGVHGGWIGTVGNMLILVLGYLTHSFATVAAIVDSPSEDKTIIFSNALGILYKLGLAARPDGDWFLVGRFPSVPGALWHQFGWFGYVLGSLSLGVAGAIASIWAVSKPRSLLALGFYVLMVATLLLTPFVFAPDFLSFPSAAVSFLMLTGIAYVLKLKVSS